MAHTPQSTAENILRKSLFTVANEQKYDDPVIQVTPVSTEGANFSSFLFEATILSKDKEDLKLFAKVSAVGEKFRSQGPVDIVFRNERLFYTELVEKYRALEDKHAVPDQQRFKPPKMYTIDPTEFEETFVLEDLKAKGYGLHDRFKSVDWEYAASAFSELAKMHALSMALSLERPEEFKKYVGLFRFMFESASNPESGVEMNGFIEQGMQKTLGVIREEYKEKVMGFLGQLMAGGGFESFAKFFAPGDFPVIRHGDFRPSNIMHKVNEDGSVDIVIVDFQTLLAGNPVIDLYYFIFLGTDKAFRDKYYDQLVAHYYTELSAALTRLELDPEEVYSKKKFYEDLKENINYGLLVSMMTLSLVLVDSAEAPQMSGDHDLSSFMQMKLSTAFEDRINGVVEDYIKWGVL